MVLHSETSRLLSLLPSSINFIWAWIYCGTSSFFKSSQSTRSRIFLLWNLICLKFILIPLSFTYSPINLFSPHSTNPRYYSQSTPLVKEARTNRKTTKNIAEYLKLKCQCEMRQWRSWVISYTRPMNFCMEEISVPEGVFWIQKQVSQAISTEDKTKPRSE